MPEGGGKGTALHWPIEHLFIRASGKQNGWKSVEKDTKSQLYTARQRGLPSA